MAEPVEMLFELWARMGPRNHVLDGSPEMLRDFVMTTKFGTKISITSFVRTIATRQLVMERGLNGRPTDCRMQIGLFTDTLHLIWGARWHHLANTTEPSVCGGDAALCQITLTACLN